MYASSPVVNLDLDYTRDAKNIRGYQNTGGARGGWDRGARARGGGSTAAIVAGSRSFRAVKTKTTTTTMTTVGRRLTTQRAVIILIKKVKNGVEVLLEDVGA